MSPINAAAHDALLAPDGLMMTQLGNAERIYHKHSEDLAAIKDGRKVDFYIWDGSRWQADAGQVNTWSAGVARDLGQMLDPVKFPKLTAEKAQKFSSFWKTSEGVQQIEGAVRALGTLVAGQKFDEDPMLWNAINGTIDLNDGNFYAAKREDFITMQCAAKYDAVATCPAWDKFLLESCAGDAALVRYLQQCAGLALTGLVEEHVFFILTGPGGTGKSTFQETLKYVWGDYCVGIDPNSLAAMKAQAGRARPDLAKLHGARLVFANESRSGLRLDEGLVKAITGRDTVTTRELYKAEFDFIPQFKLWLRTNHAPSFDGADTGMQRRVKLIPFNTVVTQKDAKLPAKLRDEADGILQWALRGLQDYQQSGLIEPAVVVEASREYVAGLDVLQQFLDAECTVKGNLQAPSDELYTAYRGWSTAMGLYPVGRARFSSDMAARGFTKRTLSGRKYWVGLTTRRSTHISPAPTINGVDMKINDADMPF